MHVNTFLKKSLCLIYTLFLANSLIFSLPMKKECKFFFNIWDNVPNMEKNNSNLYFYPSVNQTKSSPAVIICPGGSYHHLGLYNEGQLVARWFQSQGISAFVLQYRVSQKGFHYPAMMEDLQRSIQIVREYAEDFNINPENIGLIGFSAGGHLVTWGAEFGNKINELDKLGISTDVSLMPNWSIPVYPVVSMQEDIYHAWSRKSLLGSAKPSEEKKLAFSLEFHTNEEMPPIYLVACRNDNIVNFENSARLYSALKSNNVDVTFAEYEFGKHGFGMLNNTFMKKTHWNENIILWLQEKGFLD